MKLPDDLRQQIYEMDQSLFENGNDEDEELPEMRQDVLGIDHSGIMKKIATNMDKSKKAWETFETRGETILSSTVPTRNFDAVQLEVEKLSRESELRTDFVKFLERKQFTKTPERKKHKNLNPHEDEPEAEEYRDPIVDGDFIIDDEHDGKKWDSVKVKL